MSDWRTCKPARDSREEVAKRLEEVKKSGGFLDFSTNRMSDRGTVYHCRITPDGEAIVESSRRWWSREYKESSDRIGEILGTVSVLWVLGSRFTLAVAGLTEGQG